MEVGGLIAADIQTH